MCDFSPSRGLVPAAQRMRRLSDAPLPGCITFIGARLGNSGRAAQYILPWACVGSGGEEGEEEEEEPEDVYEFPYWWFFFICVPRSALHHVPTTCPMCVQHLGVPLAATVFRVGCLATPCGQ